MSSQKGNVKKQRAQKHQNTTAFKNTLHDTSVKAKVINSITVTQCCARCTEVIQWKIKYKKYKPLTVPKKCTRCQEKTIKKAYCIICEGCAKAADACMKCGAEKEIVQRPQSEAEDTKNMTQELKFLPERKRRTFLRLQETGQLCDAPVAAPSGAEAAGVTVSEDDPSDAEEYESDSSLDDHKLDKNEDTEQFNDTRNQTQDWS